MVSVQTRGELLPPPPPPQNTLAVIHFRRARENAGKTRARRRRPTRHLPPLVSLRMRIYDRRAHTGSATKRNAENVQFTRYTYTIIQCVLTSKQKIINQHTKHTKNIKIYFVSIWCLFVVILHKLLPFFITFTEVYIMTWIKISIYSRMQTQSLV